MKRTKLSAWLLTVVVFLISLGVIYWVGVPLGNPDANVLLAVEVVLAAAFAMFVNAIAYPQSRIGDQTGLGAPSVSFTVAVVTLAIAGLAAAFVGLRHPMVAAWLAGIAAVAIVFRTLLTRFLTRLYWGAPIKNRPSVCTIWKVGLAEVAGKEMNEPFQERLSEVQALCASQPKVTAETSQTRSVTVSAAGLKFSGPARLLIKTYDNWVQTGLYLSAHTLRHPLFYWRV